MATQRLVDKVRRDFSPTEAASVLELLDQLGNYGEQPDPDGRERVQAAIVLFADGDTRQFLQALALAQADWRDVLVAGGLAHEDWPNRLAHALGS
jgi:hypothetical protein